MIQKVLRKARKGTKVIYIPGNHDEVLRDYDGIVLGGIRVCAEHIHETADGRRLLVIHGDKFDGVVTYARWLALLGDWAYALCLVLNQWFNYLRRRLGYPYWSLSAYLKQRVKNAMQYIASFGEAVAAEARRRAVEGVVCGHIHHAELREIGDILYCNSGDWVESCTALVEHLSGQLEIIHWMEARQLALVAAA